MGTGVERLKEIDAANLEFITSFYFRAFFSFPKRGLVYTKSLVCKGKDQQTIMLPYAVKSFPGPFHTALVYRFGIPAYCRDQNYRGSGKKFPGFNF